MPDISRPGGQWQKLGNTHLHEPEVGPARPSGILKDRCTKSEVASCKQGRFPLADSTACIRRSRQFCDMLTSQHIGGWGSEQLWLSSLALC